MLQRLKQYIDYKQINISTFEKSIGMSNASFGKSLKNGGTIGADKLENILNIYSDLNIYWLINGTGEMLSPEIKGVKAEIHESTNEYKMPVSSQFAKEFEEMKIKIEYLEKELAEIKKLINTKK